eukprot:3214579-Rhodomonas_salina.2
MYSIRMPAQRSSMLHLSSIMRTFALLFVFSSPTFAFLLQSNPLPFGISRRSSAPSAVTTLRAQARRPGRIGDSVADIAHRDAQSLNLDAFPCRRAHDGRRVESVGQGAARGSISRIHYAMRCADAALSGALELGERHHVDWQLARPQEDLRQVSSSPACALLLRCPALTSHMLLAGWACRACGP